MPANRFPVIDFVWINLRVRVIKSTGMAASEYSLRLNYETLINAGAVAVYPSTIRSHLSSLSIDEIESRIKLFVTRWRFSLISIQYTRPKDTRLYLGQSTDCDTSLCRFDVATRRQTSGPTQYPITRSWVSENYSTISEYSLPTRWATTRHQRRLTLVIPLPTYTGSRYISIYLTLEKTQMKINVKCD